jgi:hypothetical protein
MPGISVKVNKKNFEFEWQKSIGIGSGTDEIDFDSALKLSRRKNKKGRKLFKLE